MSIMTQLLCIEKWGHGWGVKAKNSIYINKLLIVFIPFMINHLDVFFSTGPTYPTIAFNCVCVCVT